MEATKLHPNELDANLTFDPLCGKVQIGEPLRGRHRKATTRQDLKKVAAARFGVSVRMIERADVVLAQGVPELIALVDSGLLRLTPAEVIARSYFPEDQRMICSKPIKVIKRWASIAPRLLEEDRRYAEEQARHGSTQI